MIWWRHFSRLKTNTGENPVLAKVKSKYRRYFLINDNKSKSSNKIGECEPSRLQVLHLMPTYIIIKQPELKKSKADESPCNRFNFITKIDNAYNTADKTNMP